jgi:glycosyltransferase involved in cell wall biosynthesis
MRADSVVAVIIPALNEDAAIGRVISAIPPWADEVIVVDNGSTDRTAEVAAANGARVIKEPHRGYGAACLAGIAALPKPDIVVFLDGDFSDSPEEMSFLVDPIIRGEADLVIGSRVRGRRQPGALSPQARFGNWLSCLLIRLIWGFRFTDLGPFRAIRYPALLTLDMQDRDYGWTVEMQVKAISHKLQVIEVPVAYNRRIGKSKIFGTFRGVIGAGAKILFTIFREALANLRIKMSSP